MPADLDALADALDRMAEDARARALSVVAGARPHHEQRAADLSAAARVVRAASSMLVVRDGVPHYRTHNGVPQQMPKAVERVVAAALREGGPQDG